MYQERRFEPLWEQYKSCLDTHAYTAVEYARQASAKHGGFAIGTDHFVQALVTPSRTGLFLPSGEMIIKHGPAVTLERVSDIIRRDRFSNLLGSGRNPFIFTPGMEKVFLATIELDKDMISDKDLLECMLEDTAFGTGILIDLGVNIEALQADLQRG